MLRPDMNRGNLKNTTTIRLATLLALGLLVAPLSAKPEQPAESPAASPPQAKRVDPKTADPPSGAVMLQQRKPVEDGLRETFSAEEVERLEGGKSVKRRFEIKKGDVAYRAGLAYRLVKASPMDVMRALRRPGGIVRSIPYGIEAETIREENGFSQVRIVQGKQPIVGEYTVRMEWDLSNYTARFWMDPAEQHDIVDIWGVFSARAVRPGWTLVSFGFAFNLGGVGEILESKAQRWALSTADRMAKVVREANPRP